MPEQDEITAKLQELEKKVNELLEYFPQSNAVKSLSSRLEEAEEIFSRTDAFYEGIVRKDSSQHPRLKHGGFMPPASGS